MEFDETKIKMSVTRRGFLTTMGVGAAVAVTGRYASGASSDETVMLPEEMAKIRLHVNGRVHRLLVEPRWTLLFVLREKLGLTGTKVGCERGECGACTVLMDNIPRYACMTLAVEAQGFEITTLEGLMKGEDLGRVQEAFLEHDAFQCGYCTPGQIMAAEGLLKDDPEPSPDAIRRGMSGNLCRCGAYTHIFEAVDEAGKRKRGKS
ncbi:4-hydroxybenzoyl-CoA reductase subunit gamma family protein [delta proteobacterium NaphS2]|nr:4-hydroxybenzoyl-CoA reductase subunit gamma family protein [delta proteobacterium NaphS2]